MIATGFIIEQTIFGIVSFCLFIIYCRQLKQDIQIENVVNLQTGTSAIILKHVKSLGYTAYVFHLGGVIGCLILVIRSIDPFPVLGIYSFVITDCLSHIGIGILLITIFEGLGSMSSKLYFKLNLPGKENFLQKWIRIISFVTLITSITTWVVENFVSKKLMYSAGLYFIYGTIIQWVVLFMYVKMIQIFKLQINNSSLLGQQLSIIKSVKKLVLVKNVFAIINIGLTIYQIYVFVDQVTNQSELNPIQADQYSPILAPLYVTQIVAYSILLWFSYSSKKEAGEQIGMSEASVTYNPQSDKPISGEIQEVVVKFKAHEIDPKMKILNTDELQRTTINRPTTNASEDSQNYPTDTLRTGISSDPSVPIDQDELKRLMRLIDQQTEAEKEGRLEEFIEEQEKLANNRNSNTYGDDSDFIVQQIQAMKERDHYEQLRTNQYSDKRLFYDVSSNNSSLPPSPPPFNPNEFEQHVKEFKK